MVANAKPILNLIWFGSPFYPQPLEVFGTVFFAGSESGLDVPNGYTDFRPLSFLLSLTELDWVVRGVRSHYNMDMHTGDFPTRFLPVRTGGWGQAFVLVSVLAVWAQCTMWKRLDVTQRHLLGIFLVMVVVISMLPESYNLRFWLALPLVLIPLNARFLSTVFSASTVSILCLILAFYGLVLIGDGEFDWGLRPTEHSEIGKSPILYYTKDGSEVRCVLPTHEELSFKYSAAVTGRRVKYVADDVRCPCASGCS